MCSLQSCINIILLLQQIHINEIYIGFWILWFQFICYLLDYVLIYCLQIWIDDTLFDEFLYFASQLFFIDFIMAIWVPSIMTWFPGCEFCHVFFISWWFSWAHLKLTSWWRLRLISCRFNQNIITWRNTQIVLWFIFILFEFGFWLVVF